jgi:tetratricopeptide (TPR) repeat protein
LTPLVGRSTEIETFNKLVERAGAGRGQILAMIGEPGIGKSRLVHEFTRHRLPPGWLVLEAMSVSYGKATPYFPLIEMLRRYFGIGSGESTEDIQSRVVTHILELDSALKNAIPPILSLLDASAGEQSTAQNRDWLDKVPELGEAIKSFNSMDPQQRRRYTLDSLKRICIRESRRQNLLLVFEDLHWIDHETQAFLDSLIDSLPMARLLLLVNYRPGYNHEWSEKSYYTQLRVEPLQSESAEELLLKLLGNNPDLAPLKQSLINRTEGNPFYAEESVRSLVETGVLTGERGAYRPGLKIDDLVIPSTVQNVVADRIDRLPTEEKQLLQTGAAIGVIVPYDLLQAVSQVADDPLLQYLTHLKSAEFIYETNLFPKLEYTFKHALTNEVAYGMLLRERRVALHASIVNALETITGPHSHDHVEQLAHHAFLGERWDKAVKYLKEAAIKATARSANANAVFLFERALAALQQLPDSRDKLVNTIDVRLELRNALFLLGEFGRIESDLKEAQAAAETLEDKVRLRRVWNVQLSLFSLNGEPERVIEFGERALTPDMRCADQGLDAVTCYYMGIAHHMMGNYRRALDVLGRAIAIVDVRNLRYERFGTSTIVSVSCRNWMVHSLALTGLFHDGIVTAHEGISIAEGTKHPYSLAYITCSLGFLYLVKGDLKQAIETLKRCAKYCEESNIRVLVPQTSAYLGFAQALMGNISEALSLSDRAEAQTMSIGRTAGQSLRVSWHGEACLLSGRIQDALRLASRALELSVKHREQGHGAWAIKLMADIAAQSSEAEFAKAEDFYNRGMSVAVQRGMRPLEAHCHFGLGKLHLKVAHAKAARQDLTKAVALYRDMDMRFWLTKAEVVLGECPLS